MDKSIIKNQAMQFLPCPVCGQLCSALIALERHGKPDGAVRSVLARALAFYDKLDRPHAPGEAKLLDEMQTALLSPKIAAAEISPGDVVAMKEACKRILSERVSIGERAMKNPKMTETQLDIWAEVLNENRDNLAAIDRLDVKAEAKSQDPDAVAIKPLEWYEEPLRSSDQPAWNADSSVGTYRVFKAWWGKENKDGWIGYGEFHHTEAAAKAAAQADYEQRIRSAFAHPTTKPEATAVSVDAIKRDAERYRLIRDRNSPLEAHANDERLSAYHIVGGVRELKWGDNLDRAIDAALIAGGR